MAQLFYIPEILSLICERARRSDLVRLLTTSRIFFDCAAPLVWRSLPGSAPMILTGLLPNADVYLRHSFDATLVEGLQPLDDQSLVRFNSYAPYVKRILRHRRNRQSNVIWARLFKLVGARPILPNLQVLKGSLDLAGRGIASVMTDPVSYFSIHLSPTLLEITNTHNYSSFSVITPPDFGNLVSSVAEKCPHIRSFEFSGVIHSDILVRGLAYSLSRLRHLCDLKLGSLKLELGLLTALSSLPNLESLTLKRMNISSPEALDIPIPQNGFPALRHLGIISTRLHQLTTLTRSITAVIQRLTSIFIIVNEFIDEAGIYELAHAICPHHASATSLCLGFDFCDRKLFYTPPIIDILAQLPLKRLRISRSYNFVREGNWDIEHFIRSFPDVEYLRVDSYYFTFNDLVFIAKHMPRLRKLSASVEITECWPLRGQLPSLALTPSPSYLSFHLDVIHFPSAEIARKRDRLSQEEVEIMAEGLHALWPAGVICVSYRRPDKDGKPSYVDEINATLRRLREVDGCRNPIEDVLTSYARVPPWLAGS